MGLFSGILGNASGVDIGELTQEFEPILAEDEKIDSAYKLIRDLIVFTNKRLILVDKQGITGRKREYHSIPYKSVYEFATENAGSFDDDSELKLYTSVSKEPRVIEFKSGGSIIEVQKTLAKYVCK